MPTPVDEDFFHVAAAGPNSSKLVVDAEGSGIYATGDVMRRGRQLVNHFTGRSPLGGARRSARAVEVRNPTADGRLRPSRSFTRITVLISNAANESFHGKDRTVEPDQHW